MQRCLYALLWLWLLHSCRSITVTDRAELAPLDALKLNSTAATYRVSAPRLQQPSNRVPTHLQDVRTGYVYDDADDVIHIIEPPHYFQHLKRVVNQQGHVGARSEPQRALGMMRHPSASLFPLPSPPRPLKANSAVDWPMKVKELPQQLQQQQQQRLNAMKVDRPALPYAHVRKQTAKPVDANGDLSPAESQLLQLQAPPPALPREILASVRKTERLLQQQQQQQRAKQRVKTLKTHTIIMEQAYEQDKYARGQEHKAGGQKWQKTRVRRALAQPVEGARRTDLTQSAQDTLNNPKLGIQQGNKLLLHINNLLKNANDYLPEEGEVREVQTTTPPPQIKRSAKTKLSASNVRELRVLLQRSLNASNLAMRQLQGKNKWKKGDPLQQQTLLAKYARSHNRHNKSVSAATNAPQHSQTDYLATAKLLYDDVMTNIRNMLQAKNLQLLEEQQLSNASTPYVHVDDAPPEDTGEWSGLQQLQQHIIELQRLVTQLPHSHNNIDGAELLLNTQEGRRGAQPGNAADWYFINPEGKIYGTTLQAQQQPGATLFHRFPDIPVDQQAALGEERDAKLLQLDALFVK